VIDWTNSNLRRDLIAQPGLHRGHPAVGAIVSACEAFRGALELRASEGAAEAREYREALKAAVERIDAAKRAVAVVAESVGPEFGLRTPIRDVIRHVEAAEGAMLGMLQSKATRGGRPSDPVPRAVMRAVVQILTNHGVPARLHRSIARACFGALGVGDKAEGQFKAARAWLAAKRKEPSASP
jgi:hypothetical protein